MTSAGEHALPVIAPVGCIGLLTQQTWQVWALALAPLAVGPGSVL